MPQPPSATVAFLHPDGYRLNSRSKSQAVPLCSSLLKQIPIDPIDLLKQTPIDLFEAAETPTMATDMAGIPIGLDRKVFEYYEISWPATERPLAERFLQPELTDLNWIKEALRLVKSKYLVQGVSFKDMDQLARALLELHLGPQIPSDPATAIFTAMSATTRRELSLTAKFLHFCYPAAIPPFDSQAYTALRLTQEGREHGLSGSDIERSRDGIQRWLDSFREFLQHRETFFSGLRNAVVEMIHLRWASDAPLARNSVTPVKVCDKLIWIWGA